MRTATSVQFLIEAKMKAVRLLFTHKYNLNQGSTSNTQTWWIICPVCLPLNSSVRQTRLNISRDVVPALHHGSSQRAIHPLVYHRFCWMFCQKPGRGINDSRGRANQFQNFYQIHQRKVSGGTVLEDKQTFVFRCVPHRREVTA